MKDDLKTLKDFEEIRQENFDWLRGEAVKWVKEDMKQMELIHEDYIPAWMCLTGVWVKRFNLTKADLGEEK